jgi:transposase-like protein
MESPKPREAGSHGITRKFPDKVRERAVRLVFDVEQEASSVSEACRRIGE